MKAFHRLTLSGLFVTALGLAGVAHAHDNVYWSVGVVQPGISVGVSNAPPMPVYPAPVYVPSYPVVMAPRPVYYAPPPPVYYGPPGWYRGHGHGHGHGWRRD